MHMCIQRAQRLRRCGSINIMIFFLSFFSALWCCHHLLPWLKGRGNQNLQKHQHQHQLGFWWGCVVLLLWEPLCYIKWWTHTIYVVVVECLCYISCNIAFAYYYCYYLHWNTHPAFLFLLIIERWIPSFFCILNHMLFKNYIELQLIQIHIGYDC